jgi:hypothetical protein
VHSAREKAAEVFDLLETLLAAKGEPVIRLGADFAVHPLWQLGLDAALTDLLAQIELLHDGLRLVRERLELDAARRDAVAPLLNEMRAVARRLDAAGDALQRTLRPPPDGGPTVRWVEARGKERNIAATAVPLDIAPILREDLWRRLDTGVVTSATLASGGDFRFLADRLGLNEADVEPATAVFPSPFDYHGQSILAVPVDLPAPNVDAAGHLQRVVRITRDLDEPLAGRDVLLVDTVLDTGLTLQALDAALRARCPASLRYCVLLHKERGAPPAFAADYVGFTIPDYFVVGYGLDYAQRYRNLPYVGVLRQEVYRRGDEGTRN